jgi:GNAT superfamily N-acetyltransferase
VLPSASWIAIRGGGAIGAVLSKYNEDGTGSISVLLVDSAYRGLGVGSALLTKAEKALIAAGARTIKTGQERNHYFPGVPGSSITGGWLQRRGYTYRNTTYDMISVGGSHSTTESDTASAVSSVKPADLSIGLELRQLRPWNKDDRNALLQFMKYEFPGRWEESARSYFDNQGTGAEYVAIWQTGEIVGFCRVTDELSPFMVASLNWSPLFDEQCGGIGPIGVAARCRSQGLGAALLKTAVRILRERGCGPIIIDWTQHLDYYNRFGFVPWKSYDVYEKLVRNENA